MAKESNARNVDAIQFLINPDAPSGMVFAIKEAYKTIRANLVLSLTKETCKRIVVTSSIPGEGKTTTSVNLAIALSMIDMKVLLVDIDLRKKRISKVIKLRNHDGLTDVIRSDAQFDKVVNVTKYPNLHVLSAGSSVINPSEIIASGLTDKLFSEIEKNYDYIIFDAPPVNVVSDALPMIKQSDAVVFVARDNITTHKELKKALTSLESIKANILGMVYIGSDSTQPYYYSRYGRYGYGQSGYSKYGKYRSYADKYYGYADDEELSMEQQDPSSIEQEPSFPIEETDTNNE